MPLNSEKNQKKATKAAVKKTPATKKASTLNDVYNEVAFRSDTDGLQINAVETKRVLACFFDVLEDFSPAEAFDFVAQGLKRAGARPR